MLRVFIFIFHSFIHLSFPFGSINRAQLHIRLPSLLRICIFDGDSFVIYFHLLVRFDY